VPALPASALVDGDPRSLHLHMHPLGHAARSVVGSLLIARRRQAGPGNGAKQVLVTARDTVAGAQSALDLPVTCQLRQRFACGVRAFLRWSPMVVSAQSCTAVRLASMESWSVMVAAISAIFANRMRCRTSRHSSSLLTKLE